MDLALSGYTAGHGFVLHGSRRGIAAGVTAAQPLPQHPLLRSCSSFSSGGSSGSSATANGFRGFVSLASLASTAAVALRLCCREEQRSRRRSSSSKVERYIEQLAAEDTQDEEDVAEERDSFEVRNPDGRRLDVVLSEQYQQSRNYFQALIERGAVLVNGNAKKKAYRNLQDSDIIDVRFLMDERTMPLKAEPIPLDVLYEDDDILIINKPAGLVVHPAPGHWTGTLVNAVLHHVGAGSEGLSGGLPAAAPAPESRQRPGIVHRLDAGTSGVIAVAKTALTFAALSEAFAKREIQKTYLAVAFGGRKKFFGHKSGGGDIVEFPIGRSRSDRRRMAVVSKAAGGRTAMSVVRAVAAEDRGETLLVEVKPRSGRTHQIRVHLSEEHTPVLGDTVYGWDHANKRYAGIAHRPMLHAFRLAFKHPSTGEAMSFEAPLPADMRVMLRRMVPERGESEFIDHLLCGGRSGSTVAVEEETLLQDSSRPT